LIAVVFRGGISMSGERQFSASGCGFSPESIRRGVCPHGAFGLVFGMFSFAACALVERRMAGALIHPLPFLPLIAAVAVLVAAASLIRLGIMHRRSAASLAWFDWAAMAWISAAALFSTASLCLPGTSESAVVFVGFLVATEEACSWMLLLRQLSHDEAKPAADAIEDADEPLGEALPDNVIQQMTRRQDADGTEQITGSIRALFAPGQRTTSVHLAFCPPFGAIPELEFEQIAGPEASIKAAQTLAYGARLDLKLTEPAEEACFATVQFFAAAPKFVAAVSKAKPESGGECMEERKTV
jgi:hypothetical protein